MTHIPVLLKEVVEILNPQSGEFFIDGTLGSGGHAVEILKKIGSRGKLLGVDLDKDNLEKARLKVKSNLILVHGNYANLPEILKKHNLPKANGLLIDLGFSSEQLEKSGRGFSFLKDETLDMRYSTPTHTDDTRTNTEKNSPYKSVLSPYEFVSMTAAEVINSFSEKELADIFYKYGEERFSRRIAGQIVEERRKKRILTTFELVQVIKDAVPYSYCQKSKVKSHSVHFATRVFQALRIYINDELGNLEKLLKNIDKIIKNKGRIAIISFHSLEDRLVKNYFRETAKPARIATQSVAGGKGMAEILTKKPITATPEEIRSNPRSRSAKLRAMQYDYYSIK